jgi:carboxymethylenebutenolidase
MRITLPSGTPAELATPDGAPARGVALAPDIMGLRPLFDEHCARLAKEHGWAVCAPEPFPGQESLPIDERLNGTIDVDRIIGDLVAAADATGAERVAVLGFCMGGMAAFRAAGWPVQRASGATSRFDRAVAFYGMVTPPPQWAAAGKDPLDMLGKPDACPTLAIVAGQDRWAPEDDVAALRALDNITVAFYPDADHGFVHDPSRPAHRADDAADAWRRVGEFLA